MDDETEETIRDTDAKMGSPDQNKLMRRQVDSFDRQIEKCKETFDVIVFHHMMKELKTSPSGRGYFKIQRLKTMRTLITAEVKRSVDDLYNPRPTDKVLQYYNWILSFVDYLKELRKKFEVKIYLPLNTFFKDNFTPQGTPSSASRKSSGNFESPSLEQFAVSPPTSASVNDVNKESTTPSQENDTRPARPTGSSYGRQALKLLGKELEEARLLYDDSQIELCSTTMANVLSDWELLLHDKTELDTEILKIHESVKLTYSQIHKDLALLASVVPTIFDDCCKASAAARDWINLHEAKTLSLESKLSKIKNIHKHLTRKLHSIELEILKHEGQLKCTTDELQVLMKREERANEINLKLFDTEQGIATLKESLDRARAERNVLSHQLAKAQQANDKDLADMRLKYEENRLSRYLLQRRIQSKEYAKTLFDDDLQLELEIKPTLVRHSNMLQEKCEKLEQVIEQKKHDKKHLQEALLPLQEDRREVQAQILSKSMIGGYDDDDDDDDDDNNDMEEELMEQLSGDVLGPPPNLKSRSIDQITKLETIEERPDSNCSTATQRSTKSIRQPVPAALEQDEDFRPEAPTRASHLTTVKIGDKETPMLLPAVSPNIDRNRYEGIVTDRSSVEPESGDVGLSNVADSDGGTRLKDAENDTGKRSEQADNDEGTRSEEHETDAQTMDMDTDTDADADADAELTKSIERVAEENLDSNQTVTSEPTFVKETSPTEENHDGS